MRVLWFLLLVFLILPLQAQSQPAAGVPPLRLGIMPFNSTLALIKTHQPLRQHLESTLKRQVDVFSSSDYYTFVNELLDGQFDLAIVGPHFAYLALERGWEPLVRYKPWLQPVFVVAKESDLHSPADLRGKRIALSSRLSVSSIGGVRWLEERGMRLGVDFVVSERATHGAAVAAVAVGEVDAALTTYTPLKQVPADIQSRVRVMPLDVKVPHLMTMAHRRLEKKTIRAVHQALKSFPATELGKAFFTATGYEDYVDISPADIQHMRAYVGVTLDMMKLK